MSNTTSTSANDASANEGTSKNPEFYQEEIKSIISDKFIDSFEGGLEDTVIQAGENGYSWSPTEEQFIGIDPEVGIEGYSSDDEDEDDTSGSTIEESIGQVIESVGATDTALVGGMWYLAVHANKSIVVNGEMETVPDNATRADMFKALAKMKGHFEPKKNKRQKNEKIKYVLLREGSR